MIVLNKFAIKALLLTCTRYHITRDDVASHCVSMGPEM